MAASVIMDMMQRTLVEEGEKEVQDIFRGERVESFLVGSEVAVVYIRSTRDQVVVVVTLGEVAGLMMIFPVGGGGSFNKGTNQQNECCSNSSGHGWVNITFLR